MEDFDTYLGAQFNLSIDGELGSRTVKLLARSAYGQVIGTFS